jgi:phenylacetate-CoA ligase
VDFILENNIKLKINNLKAVLCASENLYDFQRKKINEVFNGRVYSFYGHTEHCCLGGECEKSSYYHLFSEYGYTEIINENGEDVKEENEMGEIVATGFNNYVMPFIRYRTGDIAVNTNEKCECGRNYKLIKRVQGRVQEFFIDEKENLVIFTWADEPIWHVKHKIKEYQYVQNELGKVILNIECKDKLIDIEINQIKRGVFEILIQTFSIENK